MPIDSTRNLPSFSEMYNAQKNQGSLADVLRAGQQGFQSAQSAQMKAKEVEAETKLKAAQASEALSKADADPLKDYVDVSSFSNVLPKPIYDTISANATKFGDKLMIKRNEISGLYPFLKEQNAERQSELAKQEAKRKEEATSAAATDRADRAEALRIVQSNPRNLRLNDIELANAVETVYQNRKQTRTSLKKSLGREPDSLDLDTLSPPIVNNEGYTAYPE